MKKGVVLILAVAIIGALGVYGRGHPDSAQPAPSASKTPAVAANSQSGSPASNSGSGSFKDGTYTGDSEGTPYGAVQIAVVVSGGHISDINFLQMPSDRGHSQQVTAMSEPLLKQETIQSQSPNIDFVSGATSTTEGYIQSLQSALDQAAIS